MKANELRNSILQLAVQGKLVPQNIEDEPASELIKSIQAEKELLIKEGKIKKQKALAPIEADEIPFEIPDSWEWVRLESLVQFINGDRGKNYPAKSKLKTQGIPFISALNIQDGTISKDKLLYVDNEQYDKLGSGKLKFNDIVFCIRGSLGKCGKYPYQLGAIASSLVILREYLLNEILLDFLFYYLQSPFLFSEISKYDNGTAQPNLSAKNFKLFLVPLPPTEEQERIINQINKILPLVDEYEKLETQLAKLETEFPEQLKKSFLHYAVQGKLVPQNPEDEPASELIKRIQEEKEQLIKEGKIKKQKALTPIEDGEIPFEIPDSWEWVRMGNVTYNFGQKTPSEDFFYIDVGSVDNKNRKLKNSLNIVKKDKAPSRARKIIEKGTVIYSTVRPYLMNICIIDKDFDREVIASTAFAILQPYMVLYNKYLYYLLQSEFFNLYVNSVMKGVAYPAINDKKLQMGILPLPPLEEQKRIVNKLDLYLSKIDSIFIQE